MRNARVRTWNALPAGRLADSHAHTVPNMSARERESGRTRSGEIRASGVSTKRDHFILDAFRCWLFCPPVHNIIDSNAESCPTHIPTVKLDLDSFERRRQNGKCQRFAFIYVFFFFGWKLINFNQFLIEVFPIVVLVDFFVRIFRMKCFALPLSFSSFNIAEVGREKKTDWKCG